MLNYRTAAAGNATTARAMAEYQRGETEAPEEQRRMAAYYGEVMSPSLDGDLSAIPRQDMTPEIAKLLRIDTSRALSVNEAANLMTGLRADGQAIEGKNTFSNTANKVRIAYVDFVFTAPKSFSIARAFAPTEEERAALDKIHTDAVHKTMAYIETQIGLATKGRSGRHGEDPGHITYVEYLHQIARPTVAIPRLENGVGTTEIIPIKGDRIAGDMDTHSHIVTPNIVLTDHGRVAAIPLQKLKGRIHEFGAIYQGFLSTGLQARGSKVEIEKETWMLRLSSVPKSICDVFSKRTRGAGELRAKEYAAKADLDWNTMTADQKSSFLKHGVGATRLSKIPSDTESWTKQAKEEGYKHQSVFNQSRGQAPASAAERQWRAYEASLGYIEEKLVNRASFKGDMLRTAAAKGFILSGMVDPAHDIRAVRDGYFTEGIRQDGKMTAVESGRIGEDQFATFTTTKHLRQEAEAIALIREAASDKSVALSPDAVERAVKASVADAAAAGRRLDFTTPAGKQQREMIDRIAASGRASVSVGVAGSGKTTLLDPLVRAWKEDGRDVYGTTLAWRQTHELADVGIQKGRGRKKRLLESDTEYLKTVGLSEDRTMALAAFIRRIDAGHIAPNERSVVVVDEIARVGTAQMLRLVQLQKRYGFQLVGLGDDQQVNAIEAGATIRLFERALGKEAIPELLITVRQENKDERDITTMFRDGRAAEALDLKKANNTLVIEPGGYEEVITRAVDLWQNRIQANSGRKDYSLGMSAPTNADARAIAAEIRVRRRKNGEVGPDRIKVEAIDQNGEQYKLPIADGDHLRLFMRTNASFGNGKHGVIGDNGSVVEVQRIHKQGLLFKNQHGHVGLVKWERMTDRTTGRIMLTYGDAVTIDTEQGATRTESILALPSGSQAVHKLTAYSGGSRHRQNYFIITSDGAERQEILERRPLGDPRNVADQPTWEKAILRNMARNFSRDERKQLAHDTLDQAHGIRHGAIGAKKAIWHRPEATRPITAPASSGLPRPRLEPVVPKVKQTSKTDAIADFADALSRAGLRLKGPPEMDGRFHRVAIDGDRGKWMNGSYVGHLDGNTPSGYIYNFNTNEGIRWRALPQTQELPGAEKQARTQLVPDRQKHEKDLLAKEVDAAQRSQEAWDRARPVRRHPYLERKGVSPHGLRVDSRDNLLVPMRDADGTLWNLQHINAEGENRFLRGGRRHGLFHMLGRPVEGEAVVIAEGYATAATLRETTFLTSVVAFDSENLTLVAKSLLERYPKSQLVFGAGNDEHLTQRDPPLPNVGIKGSPEAASLQKRISPPYFAGSNDTDWNNYAARHGKPAVRESFARAGVNMPTKPHKREITQEQREAARLKAPAPSSELTQRAVKQQRNYTHNKGLHH